jgi:glutamine synthetase
LSGSILLSPNALAAIAALEAKLLQDFGAHALFASELEFTLHGSEQADDAVQTFWDDVNKGADAQALPLFRCEKERAREQFEVSLIPSSPTENVQRTAALRKLITSSAESCGMRADFSAKPFADAEGNGLHIHLHLATPDGKNLFTKHDAAMSDTLNYALGGLLHWLEGTTACFAPHDTSYARLIAGNRAPTTISWGVNNRTAALRLPDSPADNKRIEHRVAGADADDAQVALAILAALHDGLTHQRAAPEPIYGDASLPMYALPKLPATLAQARERMAHSTLPLKAYGII